MSDVMEPSVIPQTTNVTAAFSGDSGDISSIIRGAVDRLEPKQFHPKSTAEPKAERAGSPVEATTPPEITYVDKSGKEKEKPVETKAEQSEATSDQVNDTTDGEGDEVAEAPKANSRWKELKNTEKLYKASQKEISELRAKIEDAEKGSVEMQQLRQQLEEAKKERDSIDHEFYLTRVEQTREYKNVVTEPLRKVESQADALAVRNKLDPAALKSALHKDASGDASALEELLADLNPRETQRIYALSDQLINIADREADIRENSKLAYEAAVLKEQERAEQETHKTIQAREAAVQKLLPKLTKEIIEKMPEDVRPDMDRLGKEVLQMDRWPEELKIYGGMAAAVLPHIIENNKSLMEENEKLKAQNSKLRGGSPSTVGGRAPSAPAEAEKPVDYSKVKADDFVKGMASRLTFGR